MDITAFRKFARGAEEKQPENLEVWSYTRVSSKDQFVNYSLNTQKEAAEKFANNKSYVLTRTFGCTYESASGDFTRKEFNKLIDEVKNARKKPFAILIYKMSRFSRTGGAAIAIAELLYTLGVHLIEVTSGRSTLTETGKIDIYLSLLEARKENINKLEQTVPGMKKHLEKGNWLGSTPMGYDQYGPRVKDYTKVRPEQKIVLNNEGKILQKAWQWKLQGMGDVEISIKLQSLGLKINPKKLSPMWRNPFFCGICRNKMLGGDVVEGNWEKMVSREDFLILNDRLDGKREKYKIENANSARPLNGHIYCSECGSKMVGYEVKKKKLHYYKCLKCSTVSINANTTKKARKEGANDLFLKLLSSYELKELLKGPFKEQLELTFDAVNSEQIEDAKILNEQLAIKQEELKKLNRNYAINGLDVNIYNEIKAELDNKINDIKAMLQGCSVNTSNLKKYIDTSIDVVQNISKYWHYGDIDIKQKIQKLVFPEGLSIDVKNRAYLTNNVNSVFSLINGLSSVSDKKEKELVQKNPEKFLVVAGTRVELVTSGL